MSGEQAQSCCCGPGPGGDTDGVYYATACQLEASCLSIPACNGAPTIAFCVPYLQSLGLTTPLDSGKCYLFSYGCCLYKITSYNSTTKCPSDVLVPVNVGKLAQVFIPAPGQDCCDYSPINSGPVVADTCITELWDEIEPDWKLNIGGSEGLETACWMMVANDYQRVDQFGVVKSKAPKVVTQFTECVDNYGIPDYQRCEGCDIRIPVSNAILLEQSVGQCDKPDDIALCDAKQITFSVTNSLPCDECIPCACCGEDPCAGAGDIPFCDDHKNTYTARTFYSLYSELDGLQVPMRWYVKPVLKVSFAFDDDCINPPISDEVLAISSPYSSIRPLLNDPWNGQAVGLRIGSVAGIGGVYCLAYSCGIEEFAKAINSLFGGLVRAEVIPPYADCFWLGNRQTCTYCCEGIPTPPGCYEPNALKDQPPWSSGDFLVVTSVDIKDGKKVYTISAASEQYAAFAEQQLYCANPPAMSCDWFALPTVPSPYDRAITVASISATGDLYEDLQWVSQAEYYCGTRYAMRQIYEESLVQTICTPGNPALSVPLHVGTTGFFPSEIPLAWLPSGPCRPPASKWVTYPFLWTPAPCDPETPLPVKCPNDGATEFQDPSSFCQTNASVPQIISPSA